MAIWCLEAGPVQGASVVGHAEFWFGVCEADPVRSCFAGRVA